ncbi:MAG: helix-turn-helix domain-containing protein [Solirubrobacteraceae bacterium]
MKQSATRLLVLPESGRSPDIPAKQRTRERVSNAAQPHRPTHPHRDHHPRVAALDTTGTGPLPPPQPVGIDPVCDRLLTARAVADRLDVCTETILRWIRDGRLPAIRLPGGAIRIPEQQLHDWLEQRATPRRGVLAAAPDAAQPGTVTDPR